MESSRLRNLLNEYSARIDQLLDDRAELQRRLYAIQNSRSWRATAPVRNAIIALRAMRSAARGSLSEVSLRKPAHISPSAEVASGHATGPKPTEQSKVNHSSSSDYGWYGKRDIAPQQRYRGTSLLASYAAGHASAGDIVNDAMKTTEPLHQRLGSSEMIRRLIEDASSEATEAWGSIRTLVLATLVDDLSCDLGQTIRTVVELAERTAAVHPDCRIHWRFIAAENASKIQALIATLRSRLDDRVSVDICNAECLFSTTAPGETWIFPLAPNAELSADAFDILTHYVSAFPQCRMIAASVVVERSDGTVQMKVHTHSFSQSFENDSFADSALAIRADVFVVQPEWVRALLTSPFDLVLRVAVDEPILAIPEPVMLRRRRTGVVGTPALAARRGRARFLRHLLAFDLPPAIVNRQMRDTPRGLCVIRTQGKRMGMLREAVESTASQFFHLTPCVVVHASKDVCTAIASMFSADRSIIVLPAPDTRKKRGYPCNVALTYLAEHQDTYDFLCFLDDDDFLYPNFSECLVDGLRRSRADVAFGVSNAISEDGAIRARHAPLPAICLCTGNFIPFNSFALRVDALLTARARFSEAHAYLEDWDFLLTLMASGARFAPIFETVSAYRLDNGGGRIEEAPYASSHRSVSARGHRVGKTLGARAFWRDILDFPEEQSKMLGPDHMAQIEATFQLVNALS